MSYVIHITKQGERWDSLAYKYSGDATRFLPIIEANKTLSPEETFQGGLRVFIPVLDAEPLSVERLPPWKRES